MMKNKDKLPSDNGQLQHGGKLRQAVRDYGHPYEDWLDLSTGINPRCYPFQPVPISAWNRLPEENDGLVEAAKDYYGTTSLLPVAGTQAAIQTLPQLLLNQGHPLIETSKIAPQSMGVPKIVAIPEQGYKEHARAWRQAGCELVIYRDEPSDDLLASVNILVVINPNNPTGYRVAEVKLKRWYQFLRAHQGTLIVDEAFMDADDQQSISHWPPTAGVIVLRSVGKFFGLAGIRAGFVLAEEELLQRLQIVIGPWSLSGPARDVCRQALLDKAWQEGNREFLKAASERLVALLGNYFEQMSATHLFVTVWTDHADTLHKGLCRQAVFTRLLDERNGIRFGLPDTEADWQKMTSALQCL